MSTTEQIFLATKAIFAKQAQSAMEEIMEKVYSDYLVHVEGDTQSNVSFQTTDWIEKFFVDRLDEDDYRMNFLFTTYSHRGAEAREKIYQAHKDEIIIALGKDFESEIESLKSQLEAAYRRY